MAARDRRVEREQRRLALSRAMRSGESRGLDKVGHATIKGPSKDIRSGDAAIAPETSDGSINEGRFEWQDQSNEEV